MKELSRREFLRLSALGILGAGVAACAPQEQKKDSQAPFFLGILITPPEMTSFKPESKNMDRVFEMFRNFSANNNQNPTKLLLFSDFGKWVNGDSGKSLNQATRIIAGANESEISQMDTVMQRIINGDINHDSLKILADAEIRGYNFFRAGFFVADVADTNLNSVYFVKFGYISDEQETANALKALSQGLEKTQAEKVGVSPSVFYTFEGEKYGVTISKAIVTDAQSGNKLLAPVLDQAWAVGALQAPELDQVRKEIIKAWLEAPDVTHDLSPFKNILYAKSEQNKVTTYIVDALQASAKKGNFSIFYENGLWQYQGKGGQLLDEVISQLDLIDNRVALKSPTSASWVQEALEDYVKSKTVTITGTIKGVAIVPNVSTKAILENGDIVPVPNIPAELKDGTNSLIISEEILKSPPSMRAVENVIKKPQFWNWLEKNSVFFLEILNTGIFTLAVIDIINMKRYGEYLLHKILLEASINENKNNVVTLTFNPKEAYARIIATRINLLQRIVDASLEPGLMSADELKDFCTSFTINGKPATQESLIRALNYNGTLDAKKEAIKKQKIAEMAISNQNDVFPTVITVWHISPDSFKSIYAQPVSSTEIACYMSAYYKRSGGKDIPVLEIKTYDAKTGKYETVLTWEGELNVNNAIIFPTSPEENNKIFIKIAGQICRASDISQDKSNNVTMVCHN